MMTSLVHTCVKSCTESDLKSDASEIAVCNAVNFASTASNLRLLKWMSLDERWMGATFHQACLDHRQPTSRKTRIPNPPSDPTDCVSHDDVIVAVSLTSHAAVRRFLKAIRATCSSRFSNRSIGFFSFSASPEKEKEKR